MAFLSTPSRPTWPLPHAPSHLGVSTYDSVSLSTIMALLAIIIAAITGIYPSTLTVPSTLHTVPIPIMALETHSTDGEAKSPGYMSTYPGTQYAFLQPSHLPPNWGSRLRRG